MSDAPASDTQPVAEPTLDQVIDSFDVQVATPTEESVPEYKPAQPAHIDPYDEASLNNWAAENNKAQAALQSEVQSLKADADARSAADAQKIIDADIKSAVKVISKGIEGIDPLSAEILLEKTARENEGFNKIWQNRATNPKAYEAALNAVITDNENKFQRVDTQIAENHRAAQQSQQSNNTPNATEYGNSQEEVLAKATSENDFAFQWHQIKNGGM